VGTTSILNKLLKRMTGLVVKHVLLCKRKSNYKRVLINFYWNARV